MEQFKHSDGWFARHVALLILSSAACVSGASAEPIGEATSAKPSGSHLQTRASRAPTSPDLASRAAFDAWLARRDGTPTPLDALSPGGRERFIDGLDFGPRGIGGLSPRDLSEGLPQPQIDSILQWLGLSAGMVESNAGRITTAGGPAVHRPAPNRCITPTERRVNDFLRDAGKRIDDESPSRHSTRIASLYNASFGTPRSADGLGGLSDADLRLLLRVDTEAASSGQDVKAVDAMQSLLSTLQARNIATDEDLHDIQRALLRLRRFEAARALADANPTASLDRIPLLRDDIAPTESAPTVWHLRDDGTRLERERIDLSRTRIVVTAGCHFSQDAAAAITTDPLLGPIFARHATWLMPPPGGESIAAVRDWNRRFPKARAAMRYDDDAEWSLLPSFAMPDFYIVRDGRVVERVTGWPREGNRNALVAALQRSGLHGKP